jgi:hypothetical protein
MSVARLEDSQLGAAGLVLVAAAVLTTASVAATSAGTLVQPLLALAFGGFIAFGELIRIRLPGDREAAPLGAAGATAYALLSDLPHGHTTYDVFQVVTVTACGSLVGVLPHIVAGRAPALDYVARRVLGVGFAAVLFRPLYLHGKFAWVSDHQPILFALVLTGIVALTGLFDAALAATVRTSRDRSPFPATLRGEMRALLGIASAIGATGVLIALATSVMNAWSLPVLSVPLLLAQFSFRRFAAIRATYLQTVRALSRVTEVAGYTETGHSRRVCQLALAVGRELGMTESELLDLEYAALMHDIGQLSLTDPIPGGATVMVAAPEQRRIAALGAEVIRQTGVLDEVARIVESQAEPYRRPHEPMNGTVPLASRIIRAVNAYDDLAGGALETARRLNALERLRLGMAYEYDPRVVDSLARVVERSTRFGI